MAASIFLFFLCLIPLQCLSSPASSSEASTTLNLNFDDKKTYLVYMSENYKPSIFPTVHDWYTSSLQSISTYSETDVNPLLYAYTTAFNGFACILNAQQAQQLQKLDSVLGVYEDTLYKIHTTRTPHFLGLESLSGPWAGYSTQDLDKAVNDVIIGVLDSGVWPESKSFDDTGMPEIPTRWKGECESWPDFPATLCNKKLIGARTFLKGLEMSPFTGKKNPESPRDTNGHGTHTASTAAGSPVQNASLLGFANGTARGVAPQARVAMYKVCGNEGCVASDILAGMDRAIQDGVDVLSISLGGGNVPYFLDKIAAGAFAAIEKGIFVSCSAGNDGPEKGTVANVAPWVMTVGAGTVDRDFPAYATLGNKKRLAGVSLYSGEGMGSEPVGLVYKKGNQTSGLCLANSLDPNVVRGKVVLCDRGMNGRVEKGLVVKNAGGVGMIVANTAENGEEVEADLHLIPAVSVGSNAGDQIREYVELDPNPTAVLSFGGTVLNVRPSPVVAAFSSRGPNNVTSQILKPDVIGPGVSILAAWPDHIVGPKAPQDPRQKPFNIISGTSMSCPHISGLAALLKAAHPEWSPSAIKSALMTTAYTHDNTQAQLKDSADGGLSTPWAHGAGHVNLHKAFSPGLVYDATPADYIDFLCSIDYTPKNIQLVTKHPAANCTKKFSDPGQLNYPSFSVVFGDNRIVRYTRKLTNVGEAGSVYEVTMDGPPMVGITVKPAKLLFEKVGERKRYTVTFVSKKSANDAAMNGFGSIMWSNAQHAVRSPVSFTWTKL